jgi:hypothetical protein
MRMGTPGWLEYFIRAAVASFKPDTKSDAAKAAKNQSTPLRKARRYLKLVFRENGVLFGTPRSKMAETEKGQAPEELLFLSVLETFCAVALEVAHLLEAAPGPRAEQLLVFFAALNGQIEEAENIWGRVEKASKSWPLPKKLWLQIESKLESHAVSLSGDPWYGLVLHNGALYSDSQLFGRVALSCFHENTFPKERIQKQLHFAQAQKARLVEVLVGFVCAERAPAFPARRAIIRQIDDLQLPDSLADNTREFARKAFVKPVALKRLADGIMSTDMRRFVLEQTVLASLVDGRRSGREIEWTHELSKALHFDDTIVKMVEAQMADFYSKNRNVVDIFTVSAGAERMGEELVEGMTTSARKNYRALIQELKETGELSVLLSRAARGQSLTREEKKQMRAQLIDVAKAIPALAIFAAPGGVLLLIALAKVFKVDILPSSFRDKTD